jgi:hypothetical protein
MAWPQATDYNAAVQNPQVCFSDDELRHGQAVGDLFGLPSPHSGNFADVYQIQCPDGQQWAVKCFTRPVSGLHQRYQAISEHLRQAHRPFMVDFHYLDEGICIRGEWYPILKMRWVEGFNLNTYVGERLDKPALLERLAQMWVRLAQELRDAGMAHGDLQHGNVLLVPGSKSTLFSLKLIDYDGMYVPALADTPSGERGHPNFQHPQRLREGIYHPEVDRFSHLLIFTALRALRVAGAELWSRFDNSENLLFREEDFRQPARSPLLKTLWSLPDRDVRSLVGHLLLASQGPLLVVPSLDELVEEKGVRPLSVGEESQVRALLGPPADAASKPRAQVPARVVPQTATMAHLETATAPALDPAVVEVPPQEPTLPVALPVAVLAEAPPSREQLPRRSGIRPAAPAPVPEQAPPLPERPARRSTPDIQLDRASPSPPPGDSDPARPPGRDLTSLADLAVGLLSRPILLALTGVVALLSFVLVNVLVWFLVRTPPAETPAVAPPHLLPVGPIHLRGGYRQTIVVAVDRNDCHDPLSIRMEGVPETWRPVPTPLAGDQTIASLGLLPELDRGGTFDIVLSLWQAGHKLGEQPAKLVVDRVPAPVLLDADAVHLKPGGTCSLTSRVDRRGCKEPLFLRIDDLPPGFEQRAGPAAAPESPTLTLSASADAQVPLTPAVTLCLCLGDVVASKKAVLFELDRQTAARPKLMVKEPLFVKAGGSTSLVVEILRQGYEGPIHLTLTGLPAGVKARAANVSAGGLFGEVGVDAEANAAEGETSVKVIGEIEGQDPIETTIPLKVFKPAAPAETRRQPDGSGGRVTFASVDGVQLAGTLYPGSLGKKGGCVLLLHDLGHHRNEESWQQLAQAIRATGHTVLTFDFRGHGESKKVEKRFWDEPVNQVLKGDRGDTIDARNFHLQYWPWMTQDVAAASFFLEQQHDNPASAVNAFKRVVVGVGHGATLGTIWLSAETSRYQVDHWPAQPVVLSQVPVARSVAGAVWLSPANPLMLQACFQNIARSGHVPTAFLYGGEDLARRHFTDLVDSLRFTDSRTRSQTGAFPVGKEKSAGHELLAREPLTRSRILQQVDKFIKYHGDVSPLFKPFPSSMYVWSFPRDGNNPGGLFLARSAGAEWFQPVPLEHLGFRPPQLRPAVPLDRNPLR